MTAAEARPWLSVLIPVYNVEAYLAECLASVLAGADDGVEVLLLEDCSTDGSALLAQQLADRHHPQVRLLRHERNGGLSAARNSLIDAARGDYLWFLDSDDVLMPGAVQSLRACVAQHGQPDLVLCDFRTLRKPFRLKHRLRGELHRRTFRGPARQRLEDRDALLSGVFQLGHLHTWSKIARRALWGSTLRFPVGHYFEDMATTPALLMSARSHVYMDEVWVGYRQRAGSIMSGGSSGKIDDMMRALAPLPALAAAAVPPLGDEARFQASSYAAKTYITACRFDAASS
ncbi:MAG: glycosyltransferase family 2 protein, partial [Rubrivivax sp.]